MFNDLKFKPNQILTLFIGLIIFSAILLLLPEFFKLIQGVIDLFKEEEAAIIPESIFTHQQIRFFIIGTIFAILVGGIIRYLRHKFPYK